MVVTMTRRGLIWLLGLLLLSGCPSSPTPTPSATPSVTAPEPSTSATAEVPEAAPEANQEVDVVIVGAGLSGLTTAYELKKAGITYALLELEPRVGGRVRTGTYPDNSQAEVGLAEFWSGNPAIDLAKELKVKMELVEPGLSSFIIGGKLYPFSTQKSNQEFIESVLKDDYPGYQAWDAQMAEYLHQLEAGKVSPELMALKDISFKDWLEQQPQLSELARKMIKAVVDPEIGTSISAISALDGIAEWHIFVGKGAVPNHVIGGNQKLTEAIADAVGRGNIHLNTQVTNVIHNADGAQVRAVDKSNFTNRSFKARCVVLTVPLYRLFEIQFTPQLSESVYEAVKSQTWGAYFTAHCLMDKEAEKYWKVDGVNVLPILSGHPLGVLYPGRPPEDGRGVTINFLVTGQSAEMFNNRTLPFDKVEEIMNKGLEKNFPGITPMVKRWTFYRYHPRAIASWPVKRSRFDELSEGLRRPHGSLYFAGDFTEGSHSDGAMKSAQRVSRQIKEKVGKK